MIATEVVFSLDYFDRINTDKGGLSARFRNKIFHSRLVSLFPKSGPCQAVSIQYDGTVKPCIRSHSDNLGLVVGCADF